MTNKSYQLSAQEREAIDQAVRQFHFVEKQADGTHRIELYADYRDTNEFLLEPAYTHRKDAMASPGSNLDYEPENGLLHALQDHIAESYEYVIEETACEILEYADFDPHDPFDERSNAAKEYLNEHYCISPPFDHFLDQTMKVNIMLQTARDLDQEHCLIHNQCLAMSRPDELCDSSPEAIAELLSEDSSLKRLVEQQGHTMQDLADTMRDYMRDFYDPDGHPAAYRDENGKLLPYETRMDLFTAGRSRFITSLCEELDNQTYSWGCLTVLAEVSMKDFIEMMKPGSEITMPCDAHVGIYSPWDGSGSILGIQLAKNLVFSREDIYDIQIEGARPDFGFTVDGTYGLTSGCWKAPASITAPAPERKAALDSLISDAAQRAATQERPAAVRDELSH